MGFNPGSTLGATDLRIGLVAVNTLLSACVGFVMAMIITNAKYDKPDISMSCNGMLAGLVAITAPCAFVAPWAAIVIGGVAGTLVVYGVAFFDRVHVDDPCGAIEGMDSFTGPAFHTAWWDQTLDVKGKHFGVIGTGCSGMQLVPELERMGATVTVFQRRPSWVFEVPIYRSELPEGVRWLDRNLPLFRNFEKFRAIWAVGDHVNATPFFKDPEWSDPDSLSAINSRAREVSLSYLQRKLADHPDLLEVSIPNSPAMASRPVIDNGWLDAITGRNVELISESIARIVPEGFVTASGRTVEVDVIVYATGFETSKFLWPMDVAARGNTVNELWATDGARAYLGITLPEFANLFCIYGPNTNSNQGTLPTMGSELQTRYAIQCIDELFRTGASSIELTRDAYDDYNRRLDEGLAKTISRIRGSTYYINEFGRSSSNVLVDAAVLADDTPADSPTTCVRRLTAQSSSSGTPASTAPARRRGQPTEELVDRQDCRSMPAWSPQLGEPLTVSMVQSFGSTADPSHDRVDTVARVDRTEYAAAIVWSRRVGCSPRTTPRGHGFCATTSSSRRPGPGARPSRAKAKCTTHVGEPEHGWMRT
jgi:cation diffusion facilitator CzcD-associated flavoprotein CzcO